MAPAVGFDAIWCDVANPLILLTFETAGVINRKIIQITVVVWEERQFWSDYVSGYISVETLGLLALSLRA